MDSEVTVDVLEARIRAIEYELNGWKRANEREFWKQQGWWDGWLVGLCVGLGVAVFIMAVFKPRNVRPQLGLAA